MPERERNNLISAIEEYAKAYSKDESKASVIKGLDELKASLVSPKEEHENRDSPGRQSAVQAAKEAHKRGADAKKAKPEESAKGLGPTKMEQEFARQRDFDSSRLGTAPRSTSEVAA